MTKENAKDYLPFVQALVEGKTIQYQINGNAQWSDIDDVSFMFNAKCYRVKPKPREFWIVLNYSLRYVYDCLEEAEKIFPDTKPIHVKEVIE